MTKLKTKIYEEERLKALLRYGVLSTLPGKAFDNLTLLAKEIANLPIALINLIDKERQHTISVTGFDLETRERPRDETICQHTIKKSEHMEVPDLSKDERFLDLESVKGVNGLRYYFGIPLLTEDGHALGTLCVLDFKERKLSDIQVRQLKIIAKEVMTNFELHKKNMELERLNSYKVKLMKMLSHDMRSPLNGIIGLSSMLSGDLEATSPEHAELLKIIEQSSTQLNQMIDEVMNYSIIESGGLTLTPKSENLQAVIDNIGKLYRPAAKIKQIDLQFYTENLETEIVIDSDKLEQVIGNLLSNAIKYTKTGGWVKLSLVRKKMNNRDTLELIVSDSGVGMSEEKQNQLLTGDSLNAYTSGTDGEKSTGIGLSIIKHIVSLFSGDIEISSTPGEGSVFRVQIPV